jgi:hypothetical protein
VSTVTDPAIARSLEVLRGGLPYRSLTAREIAALAANPGCHRRAVTDVARVDRAALAARCGRPYPDGQSVFAITRGDAFIRLLAADEWAELVRVLRPHFDGPAAAPTVHVHSLGKGCSADAGPGGLRVRAEQTARLMQTVAAAALDGTWHILDHPVVPLRAAGIPTYLEPDAVLWPGCGSWRVVEIKSFPIVDGRPDPDKLATSALQAAAHVLGLRALAALPSGVSEQVVLVTPRNFGLAPVAHLLDVSPHVTRLEYLIARQESVTDLVSALPPEHTLDAGEDSAATRQALEAIPARYAPSCLSSCELAYVCRAEARAAGDPGVLGAHVRAELGSVRTVTRALALAHGDGPVPEEVADVAESLRRAAGSTARGQRR